MDLQVIIFPHVGLQPRGIHLQQNLLSVPVHNHFVLRPHIGDVADHAALALFTTFTQGDRFRAHAHRAGTKACKVQRARQTIAVDLHILAAKARREQVGIAHKARHKARCRLAIQILRRANLHDVAFVHHQHRVGDRKGLALIVGHVQRGDVELLLQLADFIAHAASKVGVEVTQRLIKQQHFRFEDQRAGQRHALLLAAGDLVDKAVFKALQIHHGQRFLHPGFGLCAGYAEHLQAVADVLAQRHVREQGVRLEHHADIALLNGTMGHVLAVDQDLPFGRFFQPRHQPQDRGFAAAGRAEQRHHLSLGDGEVNVVDDRVIAKALGHVAQFNEMFLSHSVTPGFWL
ncbi:hypothetical protein D3C75_371970 [compost metagenome]